MKKKELKNLAKKIADYEYIIQTSKDSAELNDAKNEIFKLTSAVRGFEELDLLDEFVQENLKKKFAK
jgi:short-subunit dehydrogenase involved in D-alanine esterification of teichoic acids